MLLLESHTHFWINYLVKRFDHHLHFALHDKWLRAVHKDFFTHLYLWLWGKIFFLPIQFYERILLHALLTLWILFPSLSMGHFQFLATNHIPWFMDPSSIFKTSMSGISPAHVSYLSHSFFYYHIISFFCIPLLRSLGFTLGSYG